MSGIVEGPGRGSQNRIEKKISIEAVENYISSREGGTGRTRFSERACRAESFQIYPQDSRHERTSRLTIFTVQVFTDTVPILTTELPR